MSCENCGISYKCDECNTECICYEDCPQDCRSSDHYCSCNLVFHTKYCRADSHDCVCDDKNAKCRSYKHKDVNK